MGEETIADSQIAAVRIKEKTKSIRGERGRYGPDVMREKGL